MNKSNLDGIKLPEAAKTIISEIYEVIQDTSSKPDTLHQRKSLKAIIISEKM
jgi:hypothetical protein